MKKIFILFLVLQLLICSCTTEDEENGLLVMGTSIFPPFVHIDEASGEIIGFDIKLAKEIAKDLHKKLKIENMNFEELIHAVQSGKVDMALCAMTITENRKLDVNFSTSYFESSQVMLAKQSDANSFENFSSLEELGKNKNLGAEIASTGAMLAKEIAAEKPIVEIHSLELLLMELISGNVDAIVVDEQTAKAYVSKYDELYILPNQFETEYYGVAVHKGDDALLQAVNSTIDKLVSSGDYSDMVEKYINSYTTH